MQKTEIPEYLPIPFAAAAGPGFVRPIPQASQIGIQDGAASYTDGFPPLNFQPRGSGGVPFFGADVNGVLYEISNWAVWQGAGGSVYYDGTFATAIGGYPEGAVVASTSTLGAFWVSMADDNTDNPDVDPTDWQLLSPAKASVAEVRAGTDDEKYITPAGLAGFFTGNTALPVNLALPGYYTWPGGFMMQWGSGSALGSGAGGYTNFTFPINFAHACFYGSVQGAAQDDNAQDNNPAVVQWNASYLRVFSAVDVNLPVRWAAWGW